ncbi:MAG: hypothetical protein DMD34_12225 [Gemmatimonadetes bacterium]|nr:MAG: hypothetical protein DMD34_12225 [Gemmatimonadota bacterium]
MPTPRTRLSDRRIATLALAALAWLTACERPVGCTGDYCGTLVIATAGEPDILLPVVSEFSVTRDVADRLFLKLADVGPSGNTSGDEDFQPQLAERWEWDAPTTLVFHLDPRARWQDGQPVTAADVAFTYDAYTDTLVNSPFRPSLRQIAAVTTRDSLTVVFRFRQRYPEMFYDAVYHLRILPAHLLRELPRTQWRSAPFGRAPVGDGPYRFVAWKAGESIEIAADSTFFRGRPHIRRVIWRFTPDQTVAVTQLIAGDADAVEVLVSPDNVQRACAEPQLACYPYKGAAYGYVAFNLAAQGDTSKPHPLFGDRDLRRALVMATDRERLLHNVFGDLAKVPPGPMPQLWWIWDPEIRGLPDDSGQAARLLTRSGWIDSDGDAGSDHQRGSPHLRTAAAGAVPNRRRGRADRRGRFQRVHRARPHGPIRRPHCRVELGPDALVGVHPDVDPRRLRALQLRPVRQSGRGPARGPGGRFGGEPRSGATRLARGHRDPEPRRTRNHALCHVQRGRLSQTVCGCDDPARFLARTTRHLARPR